MNTSNYSSSIVALYISSGIKIANKDNPIVHKYRTVRCTIVLYGCTFFVEI